MPLANSRAVPCQRGSQRRHPCRQNQNGHRHRRQGTRIDVMRRSPRAPASAANPHRDCGTAAAKLPRLRAWALLRRRPAHAAPPSCRRPRNLHRSGCKRLQQRSAIKRIICSMCRPAQARHLAHQRPSSRRRLQDGSGVVFAQMRKAVLRLNWRSRSRIPQRAPSARRCSGVPRTPQPTAASIPAARVRWRPRARPALQGTAAGSTIQPPVR